MTRSGLPPADVADMATLSRLVREMLNAVYIRMGAGIVEMERGRRIEKYLTAMDAEVNLYLAETTGTASRRGRRDVARAWSNTTKMSDDDFDEQRDLLLFAAKSTGMTLDDVERMTRALEWVMERHRAQDRRQRRADMLTTPILIGLMMLALNVVMPASWWSGYPWVVGLTAVALCVAGSSLAAVWLCAASVCVTQVIAAWLSGDVLQATLVSSQVAVIVAVTVLIVRRMNRRARS